MLQQHFISIRRSGDACWIRIFGIFSNTAQDEVRKWKEADFGVGKEVVQERDAWYGRQNQPPARPPKEWVHFIRSISPWLVLPTPVQINITGRQSVYSQINERSVPTVSLLMLSSFLPTQLRLCYVRELQTQNCQFQVCTHCVDPWLIIEQERSSASGLKPGWDDVVVNETWGIGIPVH